MYTIIKPDQIVADPNLVLWDQNGLIGNNYNIISTFYFAKMSFCEKLLQFNMKRDFTTAQNNGKDFLGKLKGVGLPPNPLFYLVEMNGIEPSTYALRTHIFSLFQMFQNVPACPHKGQITLYFQEVLPYNMFLFVSKFITIFPSQPAKKYHGKYHGF